MGGELGVECADHGGDGLGARGEREFATAEEEQPEGEVQRDVRSVGHRRVLGAHAATEVPASQEGRQQLRRHSSVIPFVVTSLSLSPPSL